MSKATRIILAAMLCVFLVGAANAVNLTYTETAVVSGTVGATNFSNALITITESADTSGVYVYGGPGYYTNPGLVTFSIAGIGSGTLTGAYGVFASPYPAAGFWDGLGDSILDTVNATLGTYDLMTPIGPITDSPFIRPDVNFTTSLGDLNIQDAGQATFSAVGVPEPCSLILLATGLVGFAIRKQRK